MSQYTAVYYDQQGLGCREIVLQYKNCIVAGGLGKGMRQAGIVSQYT